jgi:hypothetical protein
MHAIAGELEPSSDAGQVRSSYGTSDPPRAKVAPGLAKKGEHMMRRKLFITASLATIVSVLSLAALASNPHFVTGPTFTLNPNGTVTSTGSIAGLGNQDITVVLEASLLVTTQCRNPAGKVAPGQTKTVQVSGEQTDIRPENGRAHFNVTTTAPTVGPDVCPNPKWDPQITGAVVQSVTLTVYQGGQIVLQQTSTP